MKSCFSFIVIAVMALSLAACAGPGEKPSNARAGNSEKAAVNTVKPAPPTVEELVALETRSVEAWKNKEVDFWAGFLASKFYAVSPQGVADRETVLKNAGRDDCEMRSYSIGDPQVNEIADGVALLTTKSTADFTCGGKKGPSPVWTASLYVREGGVWKAAYRQEIPASEAAAPPKASKPAAKNPEPTGPPTEETQNTEVVATEKMLWEAWKAWDAKPYEQFVSARYIGISPAGRHDMAALKKSLEGPPCKVSGYSLNNIRTAELTKEVVLLTFRAGQNAVCSGVAVPEEIWSAAIYVRENGKWVNIFHAESAIDR